MAPSSPAVEQIKARLSIVEVVSSYIKLERAGANMKAKCPFHNEKTPSFHVSPARNSFYCFGCGEKGDIFSFVQKFEGVDFKSALVALAARAGVTLERMDPHERDESDQLRHCLEAATAFYQQQLALNPAARAYPTKRGLSEETIASWQIGFAPDAWRTGLAHLRSLKFSDATIEKAGLLRPGGQGRDAYDWFRSRIMFPLFDVAGRPVAFSGQLFGQEERDGLPKYINSPETPLYTKSNLLYGFHTGKHAIRTRGYSIVVEGQVDVVMSQQCGFVSTVASSGTALTESHLSQLARLSQNVIMAFDADKAGAAAAVRSARLALSLGMDVKVARLPAGLDPADACASNPKLWIEAIRDAAPLIAFYTDVVMAAAPDARRRAREVAASVLPLVAALKSATEQARAIADIAFKTGLREDAVWEDVRRLAAAPELPQSFAQKSMPSAAPVAANRLPKEADAVIRRIAAIITWQESLSTLTYAPATLRERLAKADEAAAARLPAIVTDKDALLFEAELFYGEAGLTEKELDELYRLAERAAFRRAYDETNRALLVAEKEGDTKEAARLLARCRELLGKIDGPPTGKG